MADSVKVLFIEDNPGDVRLVKELLAESKLRRFDIYHAASLAAGLVRLTEIGADIVLLDLNLPDSVGLDTLFQVRSHAPQSAIVVATGLEDEELGLEAIQAGAQDYLVKGQVTAPLLVRAIHYALERKRMEKRLEYLATHDNLTGLPNRRLFHDLLEHSLERLRRESWQSDPMSISVMLLDLDNFKVVNDSLGHAEGDQLLCQVAGRLQSAMRKSDVTARMGGDEFTIISPGLPGREASARIARKVLAAFEEPFYLDGHEIRITASIGISLFPSDGDDPETLLKYADMAMYRAKQKRNSFRFYTELPRKRMGVT